MDEERLLTGTKEKLKEIKEKYKISELQRDIHELEKIRKEEVNEFLAMLGPKNEGYVIVKDEAKKNGKLIGIGKGEEKGVEQGVEQKTLYSLGKELGRMFGELEYELSCTEMTWDSYKKESENREMKNDE